MGCTFICVHYHRIEIQDLHIYVILLPLGPASLMHKNPQRRKIIHGIRPSGGKERSIDLMIFLLEYPVRVISVAVA